MNYARYNVISTLGLIIFLSHIVGLSEVTYIIFEALR